MLPLVEPPSELSVVRPDTVVVLEAAETALLIAAGRVAAPAAAFAFPDSAIFTTLFVVVVAAIGNGILPVFPLASAVVTSCSAVESLPLTVDINEGSETVVSIADTTLLSPETSGFPLPSTSALSATLSRR
jgi:hypothetical protein